MKLQNIIISILLLSVLFAACEKDEECLGDTNSGIIEEVLAEGVFCAYSPGSVGVVISHDSIYQTFQDSVVSRLGTCDSFPVIDFSQQSLLGKATAVSGCEINYSRDVIRQDGTQEYVYTIGIKGCGDCEKIGFSMNWVLVPALPAGYVVRFEQE